MDLRALRYFEAVYEKRSISGAARHCFIAQPSVSAAIHQLEDTLGTKLFIRNTKGVTATEAGERLYPLSKKLTGEARAISKLFADKPLPEPFRLGLMRSLGVERMSLLLKDLTTKIEHLELTLVNPEEISDARIISAVELVEGETFQPIWRDCYYLALPVGHELSLKEQLSISDLDGLPFINRSPCAALEKLKQALHGAGFGLTNRANIRTVEYALGMVSAGVGAALVPDWESTLAREDIVLRPFSDIRLEENIGLAYRQQPPLSPILALAKELCQQRWSLQNPD